MGELLGKAPTWMELVKLAIECGLVWLLFLGLKKKAAVLGKEIIDATPSPMQTTRIERKVSQALYEGWELKQDVAKIKKRIGIPEDTEEEKAAKEAKAREYGYVPIEDEKDESGK